MVHVVPTVQFPSPPLLRQWWRSRRSRSASATTNFKMWQTTTSSAVFTTILQNNPSSSRLSLSSNPAQLSCLLGIMRIFLLPISTRRTLIYCERVQQQLNGGPKAAAAATATADANANTYSIASITDKIVNKANKTWAEWENAEKGWKKKLTVYGNEYVFSRIPFEEWVCLFLYLELAPMQDATTRLRKDGKETQEMATRHAGYSDVC